MSEKYENHVIDAAVDPAANYSTLSIAAHWLGALAVIVLFLTHEDEWLVFHISLGLIVALPLLARVIWRWVHGFPRPVDQHPSLNLLSRLIMIGMLLSIMLVSVTGILIPLFKGESYALFSFAQWALPYAGNTTIYAFLTQLHDAAGHAILPLFVLHLLMFAKHIFIDKIANQHRMMKPHQGGK